MNKYIAVLVSILAVAVISGCSKTAEQGQVEPSTRAAATSVVPPSHPGEISEEEKKERLKKIMGTEPAPRANRTKNYLE